MHVDNRICSKGRLAFAIVLVLIAPPALIADCIATSSAGCSATSSAECPATSSADCSATPRDYSPWWDYGWKYRRPVTIDNIGSADDLSGYPVLVKVTFDGRMNPDFSDLRFAQYDSSAGRNQELRYWMENRTDGVDAYAWVNVSRIKASTSTTIHMYYGNLSAASASDGEGTFDFFDDFGSDTLNDSWSFWNPGGNDGYSLTERPGWLRIKVVGENSDTWSYANSAPFMYWTNPGPDADFAVQTREDGTGVGASSRHSLLAYMISFSTGEENKGYWGAYMSATSCKFEADGYRGGTAETGAAVHYLRFKKESSELYYDWSANRVDWHNGGSYGLPSAPDYWGLGGKSWAGSSSGGFNADFDYFIVRKCVGTEPAFAIGAEEYPFKFLSATCSNLRPNEGERVMVNLTFSNPTDEPIGINVSFYVGETLDEAQELPAKEAVLAPGADTPVSGQWTAVGGETVFWALLGGATLASFSLSVNWLPVLDYIPDQRLMQDQPFQLRITARDRGGEPLNWSEDCALFEFSRTCATAAEISFRPANDDVGVFFANLTVTDPRGCSDGQPVRFTVENQNDPPRLEHIPDLVAYERSRFGYGVNASDPDERWGDTLAFSDDSFLFDIDPASGSFSFVPANAQVGRFAVEIAVTDNQSASSARTFNLTVQNMNDPPAIDAIPPQTATQGRLWQAMARASDPDGSTPQGDRLRFSDDSPLFDINSGSGLVTFTPANKDVGVRLCNITVTDLAGASASTRLELWVQNVNDPPALEAVPDLSATEEVTLEYAVKASDQDVGLGLDNLTFSDDSALLDIDPGTGRIAFTPSNAQVGRHTIRITANDESGATASRSFLLTVLNVNDPPYGVSIASPARGARFREGDAVWLNATGSDEDAGDRLSFVWLDNGVEAGKGRSTSVKLRPGGHLITLEVSDGHSNATSEVSIMVAKAPKEQVTVQNDWWIPLLVVVSVAAAAGGALFAVMRPKRREPEARPPGAGAAAAAGKAVAPSPRNKLGKDAAGAGAAAAAAVAAAPPADNDKRDRARKALNSAEDAVADALESGTDAAAAMESLDIAKDFFKGGDFDEAVTYAREALGIVSGGGGKPAGRPNPGVGKLACPGCGEELNPEWGACPVCAPETR